MEQKEQSETQTVATDGPPKEPVNLPNLNTSAGSIPTSADAQNASAGSHKPPVDLKALTMGSDQRRSMGGPGYSLRTPTAEDLKQITSQNLEGAVFPEDDEGNSDVEAWLQMQLFKDLQHNQADKMPDTAIFYQFVHLPGMLRGLFRHLSACHGSADSGSMPAVFIISTEVRRLVEASFGSNTFFSMVRDVYKCQLAADTFLEAWGPISEKLEACVMQGVDPPIVPEIDSREVLNSCEIAVTACCESAYVPLMSSFLLHLFRPKCKGGYATEAHYRAMLMLLPMCTVLFNVCILAASADQSAWGAAGLAVVGIAVGAFLAHGIRENTDKAGPLPLCVLLSLSWHPIWLPDGVPLAEMFSVLWALSLCFQRNDLRRRIMVLVRFLALCLFAALRATVIGDRTSPLAVVPLIIEVAALGAMAEAAVLILGPTAVHVMRALRIESAHIAVAMRSAIMQPGVDGATGPIAAQIDQLTEEFLALVDVLAPPGSSDMLRSQLTMSGSRPIISPGAVQTGPGLQASAMTSGDLQQSGGQLNVSNSNPLQQRSVLGGEQINKIHERLMKLAASKARVQQRRRPKHPAGPVVAPANPLLPPPKPAPKRAPVGTAGRPAPKLNVYVPSQKRERKAYKAKLFQVSPDSLGVTGQVMLPNAVTGKPMLIRADFIHNYLPVIAVDKFGKIVYWNTKARLLTGFAPHEMLGKSFSESLHEDDILKLGEAAAGACNGIASNIQRIRLTVRSGGHATMAFTLIPSFNQATGNPDEDEEASGYACVGHDLCGVSSAFDHLKWLVSNLSMDAAHLRDALHDVDAKWTGEDRAPLETLVSAAAKSQRTFEQMQSLVTLRPTHVADWKSTEVAEEMEKIIDSTDEIVASLPEPKVKVLGDSTDVDRMIYLDQKLLFDCLRPLLVCCIKQSAPGSEILWHARDETNSTGLQTLTMAVKSTHPWLDEEQVARMLGNLDRAFAGGATGGDLETLVTCPTEQKEWYLDMAKAHLKAREMGGLVSWQDGGKEFHVGLPLLPVKYVGGEHAGGPGEGLTTMILEERDEQQREQMIGQCNARGHTVQVITAENYNTVSLMNVEIVICAVESPAGRGFMDVVMRNETPLLILALAKEWGREMEERYSGETIRRLTKPVSTEDFFYALGQLEPAAVQLKAERPSMEKTRKAFGTSAGCCWRRGRQLGVGAFSKVYQATNLTTGGKMAVKVMTLGGRTEQEMEDMLNEIQLMFSLKHESIVHYLHCERSGDDSELLIFMEWCGGGCLSSQIKKQGRLDRNTTASCMADILRGLIFLHDQDILHRDMKTVNVLMNEMGRCKLSDLGCATKLARNSMATTFKGTPSYMPPEIVNSEPYDWKADMWSTGICAYEMITGTLPWAGMGASWLVVTNHIGGLEPDEDIIPVGHKDVSDLARDFLRTMLYVDASKRRDARGVMAHPYMAEADVLAAKWDLKKEEPEDSVMSSGSEAVRRTEAAPAVKDQLNSSAAGRVKKKPMLEDSGDLDGWTVDDKAREKEIARVKALEEKKAKKEAGGNSREPRRDASIMGGECAVVDNISDWSLSDDGGGGGGANTNKRRSSAKKEPETAKDKTGEGGVEMVGDVMEWSV